MLDCFLQLVAYRCWGMYSKLATAEQRELRISCRLMCVDFSLQTLPLPTGKKMMMLPKVRSALAFMPTEFGWTMWFRVNSENLWATSARFGAEMNFRRGMCLVNWFFSQGVKLKTQHGTSVIWSRFRLPASSHPPALPLIGWERGWFHRRTSGSYRAAAELSKWWTVCYLTAPNPAKTGTGS